MTTNLTRLLGIMARLRDPENGCPWDIKQTFATIAPYTIEEAYEVADAIAQKDLPALKDELGDLLLQVVFHARMAEEQDEFAFDDVAKAIADKMERRHPHVFGDQNFASEVEQRADWETQKEAERNAKAGRDTRLSALDGVPVALPALTRAEKLGKRAARVGFEWPDTDGVFEKIDEELGELKAELTETPDKDKVEDEFGDLLFAMVNLARHLKIDPEAALRRGNTKFERRFRTMEDDIHAGGGDIRNLDLDRLEAYWQSAKKAERG